MGFNHVFAADFENTTGGKETYVYGAGLANCYSNTPREIFDTLDQFMARMDTMPKKSCVYFHNYAEYDGWIMVDWLLRNGFVYSTDQKHRKRFTGIITDDRKIYQLKVHFKQSTVEFRDTCLLVQGTLDKIGKDFKCQTTKLVGTIDYDKPRQPGYVMDATERLYLEHDVLLLKEIYLKLETMGGITNYLTAGSFAFNEMRHSIYQSRHNYTDAEMDAKRLSPFYKKDMQEFYRMIFPALDIDVDKELRHAYRGGYCYNNTDGEVYNGHGIVLDVNSLYPSVLLHHKYPYGQPKVYQGHIPQGFDCFIVHLFVWFRLKPNHLPFIQIKGSPRFVENEYLERVDEPVELWLTSVDYRLMHDMYDILSEDIIETYAFKSDDTIFDLFITSHYQAKCNATDKTTRTFHKIILNCSYGKLGTRITKLKGIPFINDKDFISLTTQPDNKMPDPTYIPAACFCTAYAREFIIRSAMKVYDRLCYIDTDSLHIKDITLDEAKQLFDIDDKEIGKFKCESEFTTARWIRQKTYCELNVIEDGEVLQTPELKITACGLTPDGKNALKRGEWISNGRQVKLQNPYVEVFDHFKPGFVMDEVNLKKQTVSGGCNLHKVPFRICE